MLGADLIFNGTEFQMFAPQIFYKKCSNIGVASQNMYILIMPSEMIMYKLICDKIIMEYRR